jgi:hypothetical protein
VNTVARKLACLYGKRGFLLAIAVLASIAGAKGGVPLGFFDGG